MLHGLNSIRQYLRFAAQPSNQRRIVVYSEGPAYWPHLGPVTEALLARFRGSITYVSSTADDPGVRLIHPRLNTYVIGEGHVRTLFFKTLQADVLLMTMPDLNTFHIRRSDRTRRCVYLHHSLVSSHMAYREGAFDHFDTILCAGPHHEAEIRAIESLHLRPAKQLVAHGYGRLDSILAVAHDDIRPLDRQVVLVAPSWGPNGLLEQHADTLMHSMADSKWEVIVRPHPQTIRLAPQAMACVRRWCARASNLRVETSVAGHESLRRASVMVSDWSGAAFDFALSLERPVMFIDVPRKVNNPDYQRVGIEPIEVFAREQIGRVVAVDDLARLPQHLTLMIDRQRQYRDAILAFRGRWVHNVGRSAEVAADWLIGVAESLRSSSSAIDQPA